MIKKRDLSVKILLLALAVVFLFVGVGCEEETQNETDNKVGEMAIAELYEALGTGEDDYSYKISAKAKAFIETHEDCFPTANYSHISQYVDTSLEYKHIAKNPAEYGDKIMETDELYVMVIEEENLDEGNKFSAIQAMDIDENVYYILYNGSLDIFKEDIIKADFLPLGMTQYSNVGGGTTIAVAAAGVYIEKTEQ